MKTTVTEILDGCQPQELDALVRPIEAPLSADAAERVTSLALEKAGVSRRRNLRRAALIAACITLIAGVLVGCYVAEKEEYESAVRFFDLNNFETDGLSRSEIKRVFRDITSENFSYEKSYEVLEKTGTTDTVAGVEIDITNSVNNANLNFSDKQIGWLYPFESFGEIPEGVEYGCPDHGFEKYVDGESVWKVTLARLEYVSNVYYKEAKVYLLTLDRYDPAHDDYTRTRLFCIDNETGEILWYQTLVSDYCFDEYPAMSVRDDGSIAVMTIACNDRFAEENHLIFRALNPQGEVVSQREQRLDNLASIARISPRSGGWIAELHYLNRETFTGDSVEWFNAPSLALLTEDGVIENEFSLTVEGDQIEIADFCEHEGKIYVSAQTLSKDLDIFEDVDFENETIFTGGDLSDGYSDKWRDRLRKRYGTTLFVCDPASGKTEEFYTVGGTLPFALHVENGRLVWSVGRIIRCGFSPYTSSFSYYGVTRRYDYTFSTDGKLKEERTDRFSFFRL